MTSAPVKVPGLKEHFSLGRPGSNCPRDSEPEKSLHVLAEVTLDSSLTLGRLLAERGGACSAVSPIVGRSTLVKHRTRNTEI